MYAFGLPAIVVAALADAGGRAEQERFAKAGRPLDRSESQRNIASSSIEKATSGAGAPGGRLPRRRSGRR